MSKKHSETKLIEAIRKLLSKGSAQTQEDLKMSLEALGFEINQSKISRLLRKLGAIKTVRTNGDLAYQIPREPDPPSRKTPVSHLVIEVIRNEILIVVRTSPGSASLIARVLDFNAKEIGSIGSVAGDDTIFVVPHTIKKINDIYESIKKLLLENDDFTTPKNKFDEEEWEW